MVGHSSNKSFFTSHDHELLTAQEIADELGVKLSTIYSWTHVGYIPHVKLGRLIRFKRISIQRWLEQQELVGRNKQSPNMNA